MAIQDDIAFLEGGIAELVVKYEQYFSGIEKREPIKLCEDMERYIRRYNTASIVNTMYKFKFNTLVGRFNSYKQHWLRTVRLIEEGKYSRDRYMMERHQLEKSGRHHTVSTAQVHKPSHDPFDTVFRDYIEARRKCSLPTENISRETMVAVMEKQRAALKAKHHCTDVEFRVVIEDGAPKLKARAASHAPGK